MAAKPTLADAEWGTDTNFSSGPASGTPVKVSASAGVKAQGWRPGDALGFVGAWFNYWMNQIYQWMAYVSDGSFTGNHAFSGGTFAVTGTPIAANGGVNVATGQEVELAGTAEVNYDAVRTFVVRRAMTGHGSEGPNTTTTPNSKGGVLITQTPGSTTGFEYHQPIELPSGAIITGWRALVTPQGTGLTGRLWRTEHTWGGSPAVDTGTAIGAADTAGGSSLETFEITGLSETVDNSTRAYMLVFADITTPGGSPIDMQIHGYEVTYTMPGLRNG